MMILLMVLPENSSRRSSVAIQARVLGQVLTHTSLTMGKTVPDLTRVLQRPVPSKPVKVAMTVRNLTRVTKASRSVVPV